MSAATLLSASDGFIANKINALNESINWTMSPQEIEIRVSQFKRLPEYIALKQKENLDTPLINGPTPSAIEETARLKEKAALEQTKKTVKTDNTKVLVGGIVALALGFIAWKALKK